MIEVDYRNLISRKSYIVTFQIIENYKFQGLGLELLICLLTTKY